MPLRGKHIVVTRPRPDEPEAGLGGVWGALSFEDALRSLGARVSWIPMLAVRPVTFTVPDTACHADWLWVTSRNGARAWCESPQAARIPSSVPAAAVGPATAAVLTAYGRSVQFVSPVYDGISAAQAFVRAYPVSGVRLLWPCGNRANPRPAQVLTDAGAQVTPLVVYQTTLRTGVTPEECQVLTDERPDWLVFTSPSGVQAFQQQGWAERYATDHPAVEIACIGPRTAEVALAVFGRVPVQPDAYTLSDLARAIGACAKS